MPIATFRRPPCPLSFSPVPRYAARPVLRTTTSLSTSRASAPAKTARPRPRRWRTFRLVLLLLATAIVVVLLQPDCFRFALRHAIRAEAWSHGGHVQISELEGSLFEPIVLRDSVWTYEGRSGPITRVEIGAATATLNWTNLLPRASGAWFERLTLENVTGKLRLPPPGENGPAAAPAGFRIPRPHGRWLALPERVAATGVDFIFESNGDYLRMTDTDITLSSVETGTIRIGEMIVKQPWLRRTFRNATGTTAIHDGALQIAGLRVEPGVEVVNFSTGLKDFARGLLKFTAKLAAFGGELRADVETLPKEPGFAVDVAVPFLQIDVAKLAAFLGFADAAGGTITTGRFTFRGPPQQFAKANAELRFEAANFQWNSRQWDSLVLGAELLGGRIVVPELALAQGRNRLNLSGEMLVPMPGVEWWRSEFSCDIAAKIEDLTEMSALLLPEFKYAAGRGSIDGSIRGKDRQFHGQLIVTGSNIRWRSAPIEELHASVKLNGNEYQLTNFSLFNAGDYVRGRGVMNIIGDKQYWGEMHASVQDLAKYAALLDKPILPEPLAGGAFIDWDGEGSAKGHSGKFLARLRKVRSLGATAALLHPINADFEATYSRGGLAFSSFTLSDDVSSFTARVGVASKAVSLRDIRLTHRRELWLEGDALLPLDLWNAWPNLSFSKMLDDQTVGKLNLTAYNLSLRETAQLSGMKFPIAGTVRGSVTAEGPLAALKTAGQLTLAKARLPLGWSDAALTGVEGAVSFAGQTMQIEKLTGQHPTGDFSASGEIDFKNMRDPSLQLAVTSARSRVRLFPTGENEGGATADARLALRLAGPLSGGSVSGEAQVTTAAFGGWDRAVAHLFTGGSAGGLPPVLKPAGPPWSAWRFAVQATAEKVALHEHAISADVWLTGTGRAPALVGGVSVAESDQSAPMRGFEVAPASGLRLRQLDLEFRAGFPAAPIVSAHATGTVSSEPFAVLTTGALTHPIRHFACQPPLTEKAIRATLSGEAAARFFSGESRFSLLVPADLRENVGLADWPEIKAEPPSEPAPEPGANP